MTLTDIIILIVLAVLVGAILYFNIRNAVKNKGACGSCSQKKKCIAADKDYFKKINEQEKNKEKK